MLPQHLIEEFWLAVRGRLEAEHQFPPSAAAEAAMRFRTLVEPRVGEMVYHRDPEDVAETIAGAKQP